MSDCKKYVALWDNFKNTYIPISKRDPIAPPERYVLCFTYEDQESHVETYENSDHMRLLLEYSEEDMSLVSGLSKYEAIDMFRDVMFKKHNFSCVGIRLIRWVIPFLSFKRRIEACGLTLEELEREG